MAEDVEILYFNPKNLSKIKNREEIGNRTKNNQSSKVCPAQKQPPIIPIQKLEIPGLRHPLPPDSSRGVTSLDEFGYLRLEFESLNTPRVPPIVPRKPQLSVRSSPSSESRYQPLIHFKSSRNAQSLRNISQQNTSAENNKQSIKNKTLGNKHVRNIQSIQTKQSSKHTRTVREEPPPPLPPSSRIKNIFKSLSDLRGDQASSSSSSSPSRSLSSPANPSRKGVYIIEWKCPNCLFVNPGKSHKCCRCLSDVPEIDKKYIYYADGDYISGHIGVRIRVTTTRDDIGISINVQME